MSQVITNAFEQYWQSSLAAEQPVVLDEFILADIPNLDITAPIDPDTVLPPESQIVHRQNVDQRGRINNNAVAYTIVMDTTVGDFSFNAMYLRNKQNGVIGMIVYKGRETKLKTDQTTGQTGNSLVKSMLMGYDQAAEATLTHVDAGTWQIDYAARLRGMDEDIRQLQADLYGHHTFVGDGFKVVETDGAFQVTPGVAIVGGLRVELKAPEVIHPGTKPLGVWVDVHRAGSLLSEHQNHVTIITSVADLTDHVDSNGYQHYVAKLGTILADSTIEDGRGSAGGGNGGTGAIHDTFALWKRSMAEAGYDLIGQFGTELTIENAKQVVLSKDEKAVCAWTGALPKYVGNEGGEEEGWVDVSNESLRASVTSFIGNYNALRLYDGDFKLIYVTGFAGTNNPEGESGHFVLDENDNQSIDDGGTIIVDAKGRRWKRKFNGAVNIEWFGCSVSKADNYHGLTKAISYCKDNSRKVYVPGRGALTYKFSDTIYPSGLVIFGDGEMDSRLEYTGSGTALVGDDNLDEEQELFDFILRDLALIGPGRSVVGTIGVDGDMYRNNWSGYTITNFEIGVQARGAIVHLGMGRVAGCKWGVVVRPYRNCLPATTVTISASVDNCEDGIWVDHVYSQTPVWPQTSGFGGAAAIVFRDTVVEKCSGVAYKVNRAATVIFDNAYQEQNGKAYEIVGSTNPIFLTPLNGFGSAPGTISYDGLAEVDQGYTANELFGTTLHHLYVGGHNAKGGQGNPFSSTVIGRSVRAYLSGCTAFLKDPLATTPDLAWFGTTSAPKKYTLSLDDSSNNWLRLNSYNDDGSFSKTGFVFEQESGRFCFGSGQINNSFFASFNGHIGPLFDNIFDYGSPSYRGRVAYFGTGTINTSDEREKTRPKKIPDEVLDAADSIEIELFQWLDAIAEKGEDSARWHFGAIAQQVRDAFLKHGVDGCTYGLLCFDKWGDEWETVTEEVIEKVEVKDADGQVHVINVSKFVDTGEKRLKTPAGERWGLRPDQCHWLLLAASRRRANAAEERLRLIEERLAAAGL